jgi:hypothetical protein
MTREGSRGAGSAARETCALAHGRSWPATARAAISAGGGGSRSLSGLRSAHAGPTRRVHRCSSLPRRPRRHTPAPAVDGRGPVHSGTARGRRPVDPAQRLPALQRGHDEPDRARLPAPPGRDPPKLPAGRAVHDPLGDQAVVRHRHPGGRGRCARQPIADGCLWGHAGSTPTSSARSSSADASDSCVSAPRVKACEPESAGFRPALATYRAARPGRTSTRASRRRWRG